LPLHPESQITIWPGETKTPIIRVVTNLSIGISIFIKLEDATGERKDVFAKIPESELRDLLSFIQDEDEGI